MRETESDPRSGLSLAVKAQVEDISTQMFAINLRQESQSAKDMKNAARD